MEPETVVKANSHHRLWTVAVLVAVLSLGVLLTIEFKPYFEQHREAFEQEIRQGSHASVIREMKMLSTVISLGVAVPLMTIGIGLLYQGKRVLGSAQYPYPGMMILRDTKLEEGPAAIKRGRTTLLVGGALLVSGFVAGSYIYMMLGRLIRPQ
jgi:hypothetical protein